MKVYKECVVENGHPCCGCRDFMELEAKIASARQVLEDLLGQRPKMRARINEKHDLLTTRVPLEIVCSVIQFCVPDKSSFYEIDDESTRVYQEHWMVSAPLLLGKICTAWRDIAWAMRPLWTFYRLHLDDLESSDNAILSKEWLDRAGQLPLSMRISSRSRLSEECKRRADGLIALLNEKSNHWQNLVISGPSSLTSRLNGGQGGAPNLETLRIYSTDIHYGERKFSLDQIPRPSRLRVNWFPLEHVHIDSTNLTHVYVGKPYLHQAIELVKCAVDLVYCKFDTMSIKDDSSPALLLLPDKPILRQKLESLELVSTLYTSSRAPENIAFFKSFIFPNLRHLTIQSGGSRDAPQNQLSWEPVLSHIIHSSLLLVSLCIRHPGPHAITGIILPILHHTPSLHQLEMMAPVTKENWVEARNGFFNLLQANTTSSFSVDPDTTERRFLPNLETLKFHDAYKHDAITLCTVIPEIVGPISDIQNPHMHRRPLKSFVVRSNAPDFSHSDTSIGSKDLVLQLVKLQEEGIVLDIRIKDGDQEFDLLKNSMKRHGLTSKQDPM